jgi:hypothetical protein
MKHIGDKFAHLARFSSEDIPQTDADKVMALVVDVHTDSNSQKCLEEAIGFPALLYVIVPQRDGSLVLTKGGMFSYFEFKQPIAERLTDEEWQARLKQGPVPETPDWIKPLMAEPVFYPVSQFWGRPISPITSIENNNLPPVSLAAKVFTNPTTAGVKIGPLSINNRVSAKVLIYNALGQLIRELKVTDSSIYWDTRDSKGIPVKAGIYFARVLVGKQVFTSKLFVVR